jgi:hypothetical protein
MAQTISVNQFRENSPERYARVGAMLEDFICNHTSITELSITHKLSSYSVNFFIQQYFGKPDQPYIVDIKLDLPKAKPIPVELSELYTQYLQSIDESEKLREAIEKFETANR